jgi:hypothetical protein
MSSATGRLGDGPEQDEDRDRRDERAQLPTAQDLPDE